MDVSKVVIGKLNGSNYLIWATQVEALLQARDLWKHVTSNVDDMEVSVPPADGAVVAPNNTKAKSMARAAIICSIESEYVPMVAAERCPRKIWRMLADANKSKCTASVHTLRNRLLNLKMGQGTSIREFVNEICTIERQLAFAGKVIDDGDKKYALLNGLRNEYAIKKTILQENYEMSFEKMVSSLEMTEDEISSNGNMNMKASPSPSAFYAGNSSRRHQSGCFICKKSGHVMRDCFYNPRGKKFKKNLRPSSTIIQNLKQRGLWVGSINNVPREECEFAFMMSNNGLRDKWFLDSCCTRHITNKKEHLINYQRIKDGDIINAACENGSMNIVGLGDVRVKQVFNGKEKVTLLKDVAYVPTCRTNLVSLTKAQRIGVDVSFVGGGNKMVATYKDEVVMVGNSTNTNIAELTGMKPVSNVTSSVAFFNPGKDDAMKLAHRRTCHTAVTILQRMHDTKAVDGLEELSSTKDVDNVCEACVDGKASSKPHKRREKTTSRVCELMHTDLFGPINPEGMNGERYAQVLVDDYSGAMFISTMSTKDGAGEATKKMVLHAQKLSGKKVGTIRPDNAKELKLGFAKKFLDENGTIIDDIPPYSPECNGRAERANRTILEKARTILSELHMMCKFDGYKKLWTESVQCVVYVHNRTLTRSSHKDVQHMTPYEIMVGKKPNLSNLRIFGTKVKVLKPKKYRKSKVDAKTWNGIHVGYAPGEAYRAYIPELKRVFVSKDATFIEKLYNKVDSTTTFEIENVSDEDEINNDPKINVDEDDVNSEESDDDSESFHDANDNNVRMVNGRKLMPWESGDFVNNDNNVEYQEDGVDIDEPNVGVRTRRSSRRRSRREDVSSLAFITAESIMGNVGKDEPISAQHAMKMDDKENWIDAMVDEMMSLSANDVFDVVHKPEGRKIVSCRWVYALKRNSRGEVIRHKARLVAKGYSQVHGIDYDEVFAPVVRWDTIRFMLAHVAKMDMELKQVDVKTAFLHGTLDEDIYMELPSLPSDVVDAMNKNCGDRDDLIKILCKSCLKGDGKVVLKLKKSIYGLKQAAKQWYLKLSSVLSSHGLNQSTSDPCLFVGKSKNGNDMFVVVYVDDIIVASKCNDACNQIVESMKKSFELSAIDDAHYFLGMKIERNREMRKLWISQHAYIDKVLKRFKLSNSHAKIPMENGLKLKRASEDEMENAKHLPYRELIGSLMYLACTSRPDIMYAISYLARYVAYYGRQHWDAAKKLAKYVSTTRGLSICYSSTDEGIKGFTDASWADDDDTRKSTGGFAWMYNGGVFSWSSKRQNVVAASSVEAEYVAQARCVREALWIRKLMHDFNIDEETIDIYADNQGAIALAHDWKVNVATKHIATSYHLQRDYIDKGYVSISYVPSCDMVADGMTKALGRAKLDVNNIMYGMVEMNRRLSKGLNAGSS